MQCKPTTFGYTLAQAEVKFPLYAYPECSSRPNFTPVPSTLDSHFQMNCSEGTYFAGPQDKHLFASTQDSADLYSHKGQYHGPVELPADTEFVFGSCNSTDYEAVHYRPVYDPRLHAALRLKQDSGHRPRQVLVLTLDSFSRRHFYSKLPRTLELLRSLDEDFEVTDFRLHNVAGDNSIDNVLPLFTEGIDKQSIKGRGVSSSLNGRGMWSVFRRAGYLTLLGFEDCDDDEVKYLGRTQDVHILMRQFFCAATMLTSYSDATLNLKQRCIGSEQSHWYALQYLLDVTEMYGDVSQWMYLHINTAHEASGRHAQTLDGDLTDFLQAFLGRRSHDVAVVLMGDHGMRYGDWRFTLEAILEHRLPALFTILSNTLVDTEVKANLQANSLRLVTKQDLRATVLGLGGHVDKSPKGVDLLRAMVPKSRSCESADIDFRYCSCYAITEFRGQTLTDHSETSKLGLLLMKEAVAYVHSLTYARTDMAKGFVCQPLLRPSLEAVYQIGLPSNDNIRIDFSSMNQSFSAIFSIEASMSQCEPLVYKGRKSCHHVRSMQLIEVKRLTPYKGYCEEVSKSLSLPKGLCICHPLEVLVTRMPSLAEAVSWRDYRRD